MANSTVVVLDKSTGTIHGLYSDYAFYYQAQLKNTLTIFVNSAGQEYSVQFVHHGSRFGLANMPTQDKLLEKIDGLYLVTNPNTGFYGEKIKIKYTDPLRQESSVLVEETMADGSPVESISEVKRGRGRPPKAASDKDTTTSDAPKRRGRPPKNAVSTPAVSQASLFDDDVFENSDADTSDEDLSETVQNAVADDVERPDPLLDDEVSAPDDSDDDFGDENEDGDESLPLVDVEEPTVTADDIRQASSDQLKVLAKRMHVPLSSGMTVGVLRQKLLSQVSTL